MFLLDAWTAEISDEEWDAGASIDEETTAIEENLPPPTYEDFEAALAGGGSSVKSKSKAKQGGGGSVSLNLKDIPRKPMGRPTIIEKPVARPGMQQAAQSTPPPSPPTLGARPRPRDGFVEPTQVSKPPPRVARNVDSPLPKKEAPPPPPPLMGAPMKPQTAAAPAAEAAKKDPRVASAKPKPAASVDQKEQKVVQEENQAAAPAPRPPSPPQLRGKPPLDEASIEEQRAGRRARSVQTALDLQASQGQIHVKVWQVNSAGLLVSNDAKEITGFIPLTELSHLHASAVLAKERSLRASIVESTNPISPDTNNTDNATPAPGASETTAVLRRAALGILRNQEFLVEVVGVDQESGRVVFSEKAASQRMSRRPAVGVSPEALIAAAEAVGSLVPCRVRSVRPFGIFVDFPLKLESGKEEIAVGLVHSSEISWDTALPASVSGKGRKKSVPYSADGETGAAKQTPDFIVGQAVTARVTHVDQKKARIFLSIRRATPNPLLETLDSLLANTAGGGGGSGAATAQGGAVSGLRQTVDAAVDMRPFLGDLPVAVKFAEAVVEIEGVISANLGCRLESRASSPDVEVYMAKETEGDISLGDSEGGKVYKLVLRQGRDVQEVEIKCVLDRAATREAAGATIAKIGAQSQ